MQPLIISHPFIESLGSTIIVECKNWNKSVSSRQAENLDKLVKDYDCKLGIYISRKDFSGQDYTKDAKRRVIKIYGETRRLLICITLKEIENRIINNRESLITIIEEKCREIQKNY